MSQDPTTQYRDGRQVSTGSKVGEISEPAADQLAERLRSGDGTALTELFSQYAVRLCGYAWHGVHSRAVAEELVQDVFLNVWLQREALQVRDSIVMYLFRAVRNRVVNYLRHERIVGRHAARATGRDAMGQSSQQDASAVDEVVIQRELYDAVNAAVRTLPERTREIFLLNRESGLTYNEIAQMLNISVKTVEYHMGRSFVLLRRQLADWTVT